MNDAGAAVVAWEQESGSPIPGGESAYAAVRTPGRGFGRPELVWRHRADANGHSAIAAIVRRGNVSVIFEAAKRAAFRPHDGNFRPAVRLAAASVTTRVVRDTDDGLVAVWSEPFRP